MKEFSKEFRVGLVVITGILIIILALYFSGFLSAIGSGYRVFIKYRYVDNLPIGGSVKLAGGVKIGYIKEILTNPEGGVTVLVILNNKYKINKDAIFLIKSSSIVGEKYIDVVEYTGQPPYLQDGEYVEGNEGVSLTGAVSELYLTFRRFLNMFESSPEVKEMGKDIVSSIGSISSILQKLDNSTYDLIESISNSLTSIEKFSSQLDKINLNEIQKTASELKFTLQILNSIITNKDSVIYLIQDKEISSSLRKTISNLEVFSRKIANDPSSLVNIRSLLK